MFSEKLGWDFSRQRKCIQLQHALQDPFFEKNATTCVRVKLISSQNYFLKLLEYNTTNNATNNINHIPDPVRENYCNNFQFVCTVEVIDCLHLALLENFKYGNWDAYAHMKHCYSRVIFVPTITIFGWCSICLL